MGKCGVLILKGRLGLVDKDLKEVGNEPVPESSIPNRITQGRAGEGVGGAEQEKNADELAREEGDSG